MCSKDWVMAMVYWFAKSAYDHEVLGSILATSNFFWTTFGSEICSLPAHSDKIMWQISNPSNAGLTLLNWLCIASQLFGWVPSG